jgi:hypothetical protein
MERVAHARVPKEWVASDKGMGSTVALVIGVDEYGVTHVYRSQDSDEAVCGHRPVFGGEVEDWHAHLCEECFIVSKGDA